MTIDGARIYNEGVGIGRDCEEKIRQIMTAVKTVSPTSELSMRLLKSGKCYEALLWGETDGVPIGVYNRGTSLHQILENLHRKVKRQCLRAWKVKGRQLEHREHSQQYDQDILALAG